MKFIEDQKGAINWEAVIAITAILAFILALVIGGWTTRQESRMRKLEFNTQALQYQPILEPIDFPENRKLDYILDLNRIDYDEYTSRDSIHYSINLELRFNFNMKNIGSVKAKLIGILCLEDIKDDNTIKGLIGIIKNTSDNINCFYKDEDVLKGREVDIPAFFDINFNHKEYCKSIQLFVFYENSIGTLYFTQCSVQLLLHYKELRHYLINNANIGKAIVISDKEWQIIYGLFEFDKKDIRTDFLNSSEKEDIIGYINRVRSKKHE